jgi:hypothetical protein
MKAKTGKIKLVERSIFDSTNRVTHLIDELWYCPSCGVEADARMEHGIRVLECIGECGEFEVSVRKGEEI